MYTYIPTLTYPKHFRTSKSEQERSSFDINDRDQVANFIRDAIETLSKTKAKRFETEEVLRTGQIIEGMLEIDFETNFSELSHRQFIMDYVLKNFQKASDNHELIKKGLVDLRKDWETLRIKA